MNRTDICYGFWLVVNNDYMDCKSEKDKLRALNLIGQTLEVQMGGSKLEG